ncbi:MAG: MFS transporter [Gammaproteobacteria bacterium]|nr:MFS transporter [Gammaproteobacteria bacterium]
MRSLNQFLPLLFSCALLLMGNGLLFIVLPMSMRISNVATDTIGLVMSMYFVGMLFGSMYGRHLIARVGHIRIFAACAAIATVSALFYSIWSSPLIWGTLRIIAGLCNAILFMTMETWLSDSSNSENRGTVFGAYQFVVYFGLAVGQVMLALASPQDNILFIYAAGLLCLAMLPVLLSKSGGPRISEAQSMGFGALLKISPLGVVGVFMSGITLGAFYGMSSVYGADIGMSNGQIATFMGATMVGGFLLQFPVGKLSDIFDRRTILVLTLITASFAAIILPFLAEKQAILMTIGAAVILSGALACVYPIALADAYDRMQPHEMVAASGKLILTYAAGGALGPYAASLAMRYLGSDALFGYLVVANLALMGFVLYRMAMRAPVPETLQESFVVQGPTPLATDLDPRTEFQGMETTSVAADTAMSLAEESPDDLLDILVNVAHHHPDDVANIAATAAYYYPEQAAQIGLYLSRALPDSQLDIISQTAGSAPQASSRLAEYMCQEIHSQRLNPMLTSKALIQLTQQMLQQAPLQATAIATIVAQEVPESMPEMVAEIALLAAEAAPEQRIEAATSIIQEVPEASVEVANSVAESIAASPEQELHTFLASEENENYLGEAAEFVAAVAQETPEQAAEVATVLVESVPEDAGQVVESLAQVDPELVEEWVEEIVEAVPAVADEMNEAMATTLANEEQPSTV